MSAQLDERRSLAPGFNRVLVSETAVDEEQRDSGLIVPLKHDADGGVRRGMILATSEPGLAILDVLTPGTIVYFRHGTKVRDAYVVDALDVLAYEVES